MDVRVPFDTDVNNTDLGHKVGTASVHSVAWLVAWGDSGVEAAAKDGDLKVIKHLDAEIFTFLFGLYTRESTIAYGD